MAATGCLLPSTHVKCFSKLGDIRFHVIKVAHFQVTDVSCSILGAIWDSNEVRRLAPQTTELRLRQHSLTASRLALLYAICGVLQLSGRAIQLLDHCYCTGILRYTFQTSFKLPSVWVGV